MDYQRMHKDTNIVSSIPELTPPSEMLTARSKPAPSKWDDAHKWIPNPIATRLNAPKKSRQSITKLILDVPDEPDTKCIDPFQEASILDSTIKLSKHESSTGTAFVADAPETARAVSMRDMGTEMTPIASQEPSRTGTPVRASTPVRSPTGSRPSTPPRDLDVGSEPRKLTERDIRMETRREIMRLGTQLGKANIAAWASKEEEEKDTAVSLQMMRVEQQERGLIEARAAAWEEAEKAKYLARFKREEIKIQAWEDHQRAKAEAEVKEIEAKVERMKACAQDKLMNKLATIRHKSEEKHAAAEIKRNQQAAKTAQQAEYIRRTGRIPSRFSFPSSRWRCCN